MHPILLKGGTTMSFASRLPEGARGDDDYNVFAPSGGLSDTIEEFFRGSTPFLDLAVVRGRTEFAVRLVIKPHEVFRESSTVFRIESATGVLLDEDSQMTGDIVTVSGSFNKEVVSKSQPAGSLTIWKSKFRESGVA